MNITEVLNAGTRNPVERELYLHQFVDQIRAAHPSDRQLSINVDSVSKNDWVAVVAATVESICLEKNEPIPSWTTVTSAAPIFIPKVPADSQGAAYLKRVSPEPFRRRNVFVPSNFLSRA